MTQQSKRSRRIITDVLVILVAVTIITMLASPWEGTSFLFRLTKTTSTTALALAAPGRPSGIPARGRSGCPVRSDPEQLSVDSLPASE
jgi:hypothetical protein